MKIPTQDIRAMIAACDRRSSGSTACLIMPITIDKWCVPCRDLEAKLSTEEARTERVRPGDIAILNLGGPLMQVIRISEANGAVDVLWLDADLHERTHTFPAVCLKLWSRQGDG